jgi:nitroreductase
MSWGEGRSDTLVHLLVAPHGVKRNIAPTCTGSASVVEAVLLGVYRPRYADDQEHSSRMNAKIAAPMPAHPTEGLTVEDAIRGRQSIRAYLKKPVPRDLVRRVLETSARAPSGSNIQPWRVWVIDGAPRDALCNEILRHFDVSGEGKREYNYYPVTWREPYQARRRACGWGLYGTLGITREDKAGMHTQRRQNFDFFGAPTGLVFSIDRDLEIGSWLDCGMFIQSIMIAARQFGLETCPQAAFANFHEVIRRHIAIPEQQMVICGMALGYPDPAAIVNSFRTEREPLESYAHFVGEA